VKVLAEMFQKPVQHVTIDDLLNINLTRNAPSISPKTVFASEDVSGSSQPHEQIAAPQIITEIPEPEPSHQDIPKISRIVCVASDEEYPGSNILWL
jgi:hypothetical protein